MFWRHSKRGDGDGAGAEAGEGLDDIAKLQRQFGIKPVTDADVQSEFQKLFGSASGGADSPTAQLMRLVAGHGDDGDDDEEARILRELQISGSTNLDDVELPSDDEARDHEGDVEEYTSDVRHVIAEAQRNHERQAEAIASGDVRGIISSVSDQSGDASAASATPEQVRELKMRALQLKREGNMPAALAMLREAKQMEASLASVQVVTASSAVVELVSSTPAATPMAAAPSVVLATVSAARSVSTVVDSTTRTTVTSLRQQTYAASAPSNTDLLHDDVDVQVTDDDMQDPEFLAQLASFGHVENGGDSEATSALSVRLVALETQIQELKVRALRLKRENRIQEALACMRSMRELEKQRDQLQATQTTATPVQVPYMMDGTPQTSIEINDTPVRTPVTVVHAYAAPAFQNDDQPGDDDVDSDIDVTEDDMNDPSFQDELAKLGFSDDAASVTTEQAANGASQPTAAPQPTPQAEHALRRRVPQLHAVESVDEDGLIDEFESDAEEDDSVSDGGGNETGAPSYRPLETISPAPIPASPSTVPSNTVGDSSVAELQSQLDRARRTALQLKRDGKLSEALESLRRAKQIENLIQLKQTAGTSNNAYVPQQDPAVALKFQELERLLVEFGNRAMASAKENLSSDRVAAAAWLKKRKEYAAQLETLRAKRQDPFQSPPQFSISKTSRQIEFELAHIPDDCIRVEIRSINDLLQMAGKDVYVQFSLSFPASAPHEAQTEPIRIQPDAPHTSGPLNPSRVYQFKLQRSRGTLRLFEIKKASFEVWRPGTLFRNPELIARGYQGLSPLLSKCEITGRIPFVGSNRKPTGGDIEIALQLRRPLRDKEIREEVTDELVVGDYPEPVRPASTDPLPQIPAVTQPQVPASSAEAEVAAKPEQSMPEKQSEELDPHDLELIVSYDVINEELEKIEAKIPSLSGVQASELRDRLDSLALKKQLLEIEMQTGKLTLEMYTVRLHTRIADDRKLIAALMRLGRRSDAARVLHRVKIMEKELEGAADGEEEGVEF